MMDHVLTFFGTPIDVISDLLLVAFVFLVLNGEVSFERRDNLTLRADVVQSALVYVMFFRLGREFGKGIAVRGLPK
jgi:hypothetical protein